MSIFEGSMELEHLFSKLIIAMPRITAEDILERAWDDCESEESTILEVV